MSQSVLEELLHRFETTERARTRVEAPVELTNAYVTLTFAAGFARLGAAGRAVELRDRAVARLINRDPVHSFLSALYGEKIAQALDGEPPETPHSVGVAVMLNGLERFLRYKIDILREGSDLLEPVEQINALVSFHRVVDPRRADLRVARGDELAKVVQQLSESGGGEPANVTLLEVICGLDEHEARRHLREALPKCTSAASIRGAVAAATRFGMVDVLVDLRPDVAAALAEEEPSPALLWSWLEAARRFSLEPVLAASSDSWPLRLGMAAAHALSGKHDDARAVVAESIAQDMSSLHPITRRELLRRIALAASFSGQDFAIDTVVRVAHHLPTITDAFNTNSHYCRSVILFMESLVLALTPYLARTRTTQLLNDASALETAAMSQLRDFAEPLWQSQPHGPPALQVLRDWLEERGEKPDHATLAQMLRSRDARRQSRSI
jgi:hypothetical protein